MYSLKSAELLDKYIMEVKGTVLFLEFRTLILDNSIIIMRGRFFKGYGTRDTTILFLIHNFRIFKSLFLIFLLVSHYSEMFLFHI